jgi:hypothetical protein
MNLTLSWDLFVIVFAALIVAYTFIIGRGESIKIIIASYIGIIAVQGIASALERLNAQLGSIVSYLGIPAGQSWILVVGKLVLFIAIVILLTIRSGIEVRYDKEPNAVIGIVLTLLFGIATAGLLITTILTYVTGVPLLEMNLSTVQALGPVIQQSQIMQLLIQNQDVCFTLPAVVLAVMGLTHNS